MEYIFKHSRVLLGTKPSKLFAVNKYYVPMQRVIICNISFKLPQHLLEKIAMLLQTVQNVCQSSKAFLWKMIIYIYMYCWKVKSFLANLWSIPPRKCNMSLQQIPLMMQQCLKPLWYYFSRVYYHFYATCVSKRTAILQQKCFLERTITRKWSFSLQQKHLWIQQTMCLKNAFVCLRKFCCVYNGPMKTNGVFLLQESVTLP